MHDTAGNTEYGVTPTEIVASMAGIDFVRAIFERRLPEPPIMQTVEPLIAPSSRAWWRSTAFPASGITIRSDRCMAATPRS
jgi:hypothetical protein